MNVTIKHLRYLQALAEEGHFGRAADKVAVSQPALSAQIRDLEEILGCQLVERSTTGARLTRIGDGVLRRAAHILAQVRDLEDFARQDGQPLSGAMSMGIIPSIAPYLLPRMLPLIAGRFPALRLAIRETVTDHLLAELPTASSTW